MIISASNSCPVTGLIVALPSLWCLKANLFNRAIRLFINAPAHTKNAPTGAFWI